MSNVFVDDKGEGFPFVLVHGYLGSSEMWCFQKDTQELISEMKVSVKSNFEIKFLDILAFKGNAFKIKFQKVLVSKILVFWPAGDQHVQFFAKI